jgi:hypothetical protein
MKMTEKADNEKVNEIIEQITNEDQKALNEMDEIVNEINQRMKLIKIWDKKKDEIDEHLINYGLERKQTKYLKNELLSIIYVKKFSKKLNKKLYVVAKINPSKFGKKDWLSYVDRQNYPISLTEAKKIYNKKIA